MDVARNLKIESVLRLNPTPPWQVAPTQTVAEAVALMREKSVGCVLVCNERKIVGIFTERDLMRRELGAKINQALTKLTPRERMVFELKHYQGLRLRTIGEMLNTTEETAKNTLFRATQKLRSALTPMR